VRERERR
jgi:hypothetical protein